MKLAVAVIHGIGDQKKDFAKGLIKKLKHHFAKSIPKSKRQGKTIDQLKNQLIIESVWWSPVLSGHERNLWKKVEAKHRLGWKFLRKPFVEFAGDAIAYQKTRRGRGNYYQIHRAVHESLKRLASRAGAAPLTVISHSLGTVIASNYFYDLQYNKADPSLRGKSALTQGKTLTNFYTLGSPIAVWSLRHPNMRNVIKVPGEWINFFDRQDPIGYPLKSLSSHYNSAVAEDKMVRVGGIFSGMTPLSHTLYWKAGSVIKPIARRLATDWITLNR